MRLPILFWCYRDLVVCKNRLRMWRHLNPGRDVYGLYGGPLVDRGRFEEALGPLVDDFWSYPEDRDRTWKWRNGDLMLARWFTDRGSGLAWDSAFVAQWDMVATAALDQVLPPLRAGDMLLSGLRPLREVEAWWQWTQPAHRDEYTRFRAVMEDRFGPIVDPLCCQFIGVVAPREFLARYAEAEPGELGFLEYKVPMYAQAFGTPLVPDRCFRPWWAEEPGTAGVKRTERLVHAWPTQVRLSVMAYEALRPGGRRVFHPYRGVYPHDLESLGELTHHRRGGR